MIKFLALISLWCLVTSLSFNYVADWPQDPNSDRPPFNESSEEGPLRKKANEYDVWNAKFHHPYYGGMVKVQFAQ